MARFEKKLHKLHAPRGTDEANANGVLYRVDNDGTINVPDEAVDPLLSLGGFTEEDQSDDDPSGEVLMKSMTGALGCSWGGNSYEPDSDGFFVVPAVAAVDLADHGFVAAERSAKASAKVPQLKI